MNDIAPDDAQLHVHGASSNPDYERALRAIPTNGNVQFHGAFSHDDIPAILAKLDAVIVPSLWYENRPFVILEARQVGVPVIASRLGGLAEAVEEGRDGWLFEPGDAADLAARLQACVDAPETLAALDTRPPPDIAENYDRILECYGGTPCSV